MKIFELMANLLIVLVSLLGFIRGMEWIVRSSHSLQQSSDIYITINQYMDIQSLGWLLVIASIVLFSAVFIKGSSAYISMIIGGIGIGTIFLFYGLVTVEAATLISTYYTMLTVSIYGYLLAGIGASALWKIKRKK